MAQQTVHRTAVALLALHTAVLHAHLIAVVQVALRTAEVLHAHLTAVVQAVRLIAVAHHTVAVLAHLIAVALPVVPLTAVAEEAVEAVVAK